MCECRWRRLKLSSPAASGYYPRPGARLRQGPGRGDQAGNPQAVCQQGKLAAQPLLTLARADERSRSQVIPEVGLCISLLDMIECSEGAVLYGDGCFYYKCEHSLTAGYMFAEPRSGVLTAPASCLGVTFAGQFRLIILRPYIGEAFVGKVKSQSEHGIVGKSKHWPTSIHDYRH